MRNELALVELFRAVEGLLRLRAAPPRPSCTSGVSLDRRQMARLGRAVFRQRARQRGLLVLEVVFELLAIELDERLAGLHVIAKVHEHAADGAFGLRGNRDLVFGGERADDLDGTS